MIAIVGVLQPVRPVSLESPLHVYRGRDMFDKLHLLSQDVPDGGQGVCRCKHPYLRIVASGAKGPAVFDWDERQRKDLAALWRDPTADGARERLARDLAAFCEQLSWRPDAKLLDDAERCGEEYMLTLSAVPPEL